MNSCIYTGNVRHRRFSPVPHAFTYRLFDLDGTNFYGEIFVEYPRVLIDQVATLRVLEKMRLEKGGQGLRKEIQALISRLTSGGMGARTEDVRAVQAKVLWDKGWGKELGYGTFSDYLATIPEAPPFPEKYDERFPILTLVDARPGIGTSCDLAWVGHGDDTDYADFESAESRDRKVYWIRCQDGQRNHGRNVLDCRRSFATDERGLTPTEGVALFAQRPQAIDAGTHSMDLPGCSDPETDGLIPNLCEDWNLRPHIFWRYAELHLKDHGSASRGI